MGACVFYYRKERICNSPARDIIAGLDEIIFFFFLPRTDFECLSRYKCLSRYSRLELNNIIDMKDFSGFQLANKMAEFDLEQHTDEVCIQIWSDEYRQSRFPSWDINEVAQWLRQLSFLGNSSSFSP